MPSSFRSAILRVGFPRLRGLLGRSGSAAALSTVSATAAATVSVSASASTASASVGAGSSDAATATLDVFFLSAMLGYTFGKRLLT